MPVNIWGNPEPKSLFYDTRTADYCWYPTYYAVHPIWGQFLTLQSTSHVAIPGTDSYTITIPGSGGGGGSVTLTTYPGSNVFPSATLTAGTYVTAGSGSGSTTVVTYPGSTLMPGANTTPGTYVIPGSGGGGDTIIVVPATPYNENIVTRLPDVPRVRT